MNTFQTHMNQYPAPGIPGAFASDNPHASYVAGEGALIYPLASRRFTFAITKKREKSGTALSKPVRVILLRMWLFLSTRSPFHPVLSSVR